MTLERVIHVVFAFSVAMCIFTLINGGLLASVWLPTLILYTWLIVEKRGYERRQRERDRPVDEFDRVDRWVQVYMEPLIEGETEVDWDDMVRQLDAYLWPPSKRKVYDHSQEEWAVVYLPGGMKPSVYLQGSRHKKWYH